MKPKFSIIVALAPERKIEIIRSLKKMDYPKNEYEVIIEKGKNPSENRNKGAKKAKGDILAFIDDDAIVDKNLLKNAENFFDLYKYIGIVGGPQLTPKTDRFFARISGYVLASYLGTFKMYKRYKKAKLNLNADEFSLSSANCFVKKNIFNKIKGFDTRLHPGEDPEFFARAKAKGVRIAYSPDVFIYHKRRSNLFDFCKQFYKYGKVRLQKERIRKTKVNPIFLTPLLFVIYLILLPLTFISKIYLVPLLIYLLLAILNSVYLSFKNKDLFSLIFLPFIYLSLHVSYGVGMLRGLFNG